jgi:hypothetical protein
MRGVKENDAICLSQNWQSAVIHGSQELRLPTDFSVFESPSTVQSTRAVT